MGLIKVRIDVKAKPQIFNLLGKLAQDGVIDNQDLATLLEYIKN
jgi:hypothetical protein